jgi:hypothetical protein
LRIAYVVACYFGDRRTPDRLYEENRLCHLDQQIKALTKVEANLITDIIFVANGGLPEHTQLPSEINGKSVSMYERDNYGMSYGAWDFVYQKAKEDFDYLFLIEDDYIPVIDNFDKIFLDQFYENTGYVCSLYQDDHAAITNGVISIEAINYIGEIPHAKNNDYGHNEFYGQRGLSRIIEIAEYGVEHIADKYCVPFNSVGNIIYYGKPNSDIVLSPTVLERNKNDSII